MSARPRRLLRPLPALVIGAVAVVASAGAALAAWTLGSIGATGGGAARTLPAGPTPTATATGAAVTVSFPQIAVGGTALGALAGGGYTVTRYDAGGAVQTVGGQCRSTVRGPARTLSCVDANVASGRWFYRVTPVLAGWRGGEGLAGAPVTVTVGATPRP